MQLQDLEGQYTIKGKNQNAEGSAYSGILTLSLTTAFRVKATWQIGNLQIQQGTGFFKHNILVINFSYIGDDEAIYKGVVVYKCLTKDVLEGFWSEKQGQQEFLGEEHCFRIGTLKETIN